MEIDKSKIRLFAFLSAIFIFLVSVFSNGLNVFADGTYSLTSLLGINDSYVTKDDYNSDYLLDSSSSYLSAYTNCVGFGLNISNSVYNSNPNLTSGYSDYVGFIRNDGQLVSFYALPEDSFVVVFSNGVYVFNGTDTNDNAYPNVFYSSNGNYFGSGVSYTSSVTVDNQAVNVFVMEGNYKLISSSCDIYTYSEAYYNWDGSKDSLGDNINPNSSSSGETAANNLFMTDSDFVFQNSRFVAPYSSLINTGGIYPNGSITFSGIPNSYQYEHSNEFYLTFSFTFTYDVVYKNQTNADIGPFKTTSTLLNTKKNYKTKLVYNVGGSEFIDVPLSEFISNGNSKSWTMEEILSHMQGEYDYSTLLSQSKEVTEISYNSFDINCTAVISSGVDSSGTYSEWYNPMSNKGYTTSQNMKVNENPYYGSADSQGDSDYYGELNAPGTAGNGTGSGSGSSSSNSSSTTGEIVINNYNEVNVGDNSASGGSGSGSGSPSNQEEAGLALNFYNTFNPFKLIFNSLSDGNSAVAEETEEIIGSNSFLQFLGSSFSFLPQSLIDKLAWYVGACLTILVIAVVLRVILDLL